MKSSKTFQPDDLFKIFNIKIPKEGEKILNGILSFLLYLPSGCKIETSSGITLQKLNEDLIFIDGKIETSEFLNSLKEHKIIRIPV